jgi:hypothetical protein
MRFLFDHIHNQYHLAVESARHKLQLTSTFTTDLASAPYILVDSGNSSSSSRMDRPSCFSLKFVDEHVSLRSLQPASSQPFNIFLRLPPRIFNIDACKHRFDSLSYSLRTLLDFMAYLHAIIIDLRLCGVVCTEISTC